MRRPQSSTVTPLARHPRARLAAALAIALTALAVLVAPAAAADGLTMEATVLLDGHVRSGSWVAVDVHLRNDGPAITGELRLAGGSQGRTRFSTAVDLPTQSDKVYRLYVQPPAFGTEMEIALADGATTVATATATFAIHDATQLVVGVVAEQPGEIIGGLRLLPNQNGLAPTTVALDLADLPGRVEAWGAMDRLVWQDTDSTRLAPEQLAALRGWIAAGGRLVIVGGTSGPGSLSAFPDALLPYRPTATTDVDPASLTGLLGPVPDDATTLPGLSGELAAGRALVTVGDRTVAAERAYGSGAVTVIGFDPTVSWIADSDLGEGLWRQVLPPRAGVGPTLVDDSQIVSAASQLPALALPPIGGLLALLGAYILLIGPINYLVLRRLDRRELAWITMPVLIAVFGAGAYGYGAILRGSEIIVNEVAIVRGAPGATEGTAQVYLGIFSPSRGTYQLRVPGGALLSSPISGDFFGGDGTGATLDVLQGDPSSVRNLAVSFGSLRTVRAESPVEVPLVETDLRLVDDRLVGTVRNASTDTLHDPAVVLGSTVATLQDLAPGATARVDVAMTFEPFGQALSDKIVGPVFFGDPAALGDDAARLYARHTIINQLAWDPEFGTGSRLPADGPVVLAWADGQVLDVEIAGQTPRRTSNILYFLPSDLAVAGTATFRADLLRSTVVASDAGFFTKNPYNMSFGQGSVELSYRPVAFSGRFDATQLVLGFNFGDMGLAIDPKPIEPLDHIPGACDGSEDADPACPIAFDGLPETELFDVTAGEWRRFPHLEMGTRFAIADPQRYVDPMTGAVLLRFVNDRSEQVGFGFDLTIAGTMR